MKSVLISIQPYWVFLIIAKIMGWEIEQHKTIEVRKNYPKDESWDKTAIIYCSKDKKSFNRIPKEYQPLMQNFLGKVIGEFVCDRIDKVYQCNSGWVQEYGCISRNEFFDYLGIPYNLHFDDKGAFAWHISDLKIYGEPKELSEFWTIKCTNKRNGCQGCKVKPSCIKTITRPFQSWGYIESLGE